MQLQAVFPAAPRDLKRSPACPHFEYVKNEDLEKIGMGRPGRWGVLASPIVTPWTS